MLAQCLIAGKIGRSYFTSFGISSQDIHSQFRFLIRAHRGWLRGRVIALSV
jgi:hypothetical protein